MFIPGIASDFPAEAFTNLAKRGKLRHLTLLDSKMVHSFFVLPLPTFHNLTTLKLYGKTEWQSVIEVLLSSPALQSLALDFNFLMQDSEDGTLYSFVEAYDIQRKKRKLPLLKIKELEFGKGFLPTETETDNDYDLPNYLSNLTDLSALKNVKINNAITETKGGSPEMTIYDIDATLFFPALNLEHIAFSCFTRDIFDIIEHVNLGSTGSIKLTSLDTIESCPPGPNNLCEDPWGKQFYDPSYFENFEIPLHVGGFHWKSLHFREGENGEEQEEKVKEYILEFVGRCEDLEELTWGMDSRTFEIFKGETLPTMKRLRTLVIPRYPGSPEMPVIPRSSVEHVDITVSDKRHSATFQEERYRLAIAKELFKINREAFESRGEGQDKGTKLKYLGLGTSIYTCMLPALRDIEDGTNVEWKVVKLSKQEAFEFEGVKNLLMKEGHIKAGPLMELKDWDAEEDWNDAATMVGDLENEAKDMNLEEKRSIWEYSDNDTDDEDEEASEKGGSVMAQGKRADRMIDLLDSDSGSDDENGDDRNYCSSCEDDSDDEGASLSVIWEVDEEDEDKEGWV